MAKMIIWGAIGLLLVLEGLDCTSCVSTITLLRTLDPISQTKHELKKRMPGFIQEKINRDNQTTRFIELEYDLDHLNRCNRTNRIEVSNKIKTVLVKEAELLTVEVFGLIHSAYLIVVAILSALQLKFFPPSCAGGQQGSY